MRMHLASLVEDFRAHAEETAVVAHLGVRRYATRYGDLAQLAGRFNAELARQGIMPGERVVIWGGNSPEWIAAFFGCLLRGVLAVPLDAGGSSEFAGRVVRDVAPRLIVADSALLRGLDSPVPKFAISDMSATLPANPHFTVNGAVREDTPFQIVFTSGTTSEPKGIVHTHRNVLASLQPIEQEIAKYRKYERWVHPLRFLHTLPLSHVFGQFMGLWIPAILAAEIHFTDQLEPASEIALIRRERISVLIAVPRVLDLLRSNLLQILPSLAADLETSNDLSILKRWWRFRAVHRAFGWKFWAVISGGASLPVEMERFWNRLGFALIQGYGMTETAALVTLNHPFRIGQGTIGQVLPGREVRLSETGELLVRGDMVSGATWQQGRMQQREGEWLATGDLAEQSDSGELRFTGRKGDVIVTANALNIYPEDLEAALGRQPGVRAAVVVSCELAGGSEPVAVVLFSGDEQALGNAVRTANSSLAEYQHVRRTLRWPEPVFPYTSTGKLLRRDVRQWACAALLGGEASRLPGSDPLMKLISEATGEQTASGDDSLRLSDDLHLDSLGRVQLGSLLEQRLGIVLQDEQLAGLETVGQLRSLLQAGRAEQGFGVDRASEAVAMPADGSPKEVTPRANKSVPPIATDAALSGPQCGSDRHLYPHWPWSWLVKLLRIAFLESILRPLVGLLLAPRVVRRTQALPTGPLLIIANHVTGLDGALILHALPRSLRWRVAIAMSGEMLLEFRRGQGQRNTLRNIVAPAAYWLLTALFNVFPLPRLQGFRQSFAHAGEAMDRGYSVLIFPEGTRSRDGSLQRFRPGVGLLAAQSRVPVLPVALVGLDDLRSGKVNWFRSGRLEVRIGNPVTLPQDTSPVRWTEELQSAMQGESQQTSPEPGVL